MKKKTVLFVARESEIITAMPAHLCLRVSVWYNLWKTDSLFTRCKVDLCDLSSFRDCSYAFADLDINEEMSVLSQLHVAKQFYTRSKNRAKGIEYIDASYPQRVHCAWNWRYDKALMMVSQSQVEYEIISAITNGCILEPHSKLSMSRVWLWPVVILLLWD